MRSWNLFNELEDLHREFDNIFGLRSMDYPRTGLYPGRFPQMSVHEDAENYFVEAVVPGIDAKELDMSVTGNTLTVSGNRNDNLDETASWHKRERGTGQFTRTLELPKEVDSKKAQAEYQNGILTVTLPKAEAAKPKRIAIKAH